MVLFHLPASKRVPDLRCMFVVHILDALILQTAVDHFVWQPLIGPPPEIHACSSIYTHTTHILWDLPKLQGKQFVGLSHVLACILAPQIVEDHRGKINGEIQSFK